jgi:type IV pilus assembly protein PilQ
MRSRFLVVLLSLALSAQAWDPFDDTGITVSYNAPNITVQAQSVGLREVIAKLAQILEINMVLADNINHKVTIHLLNLPWQQALETLLASQNLQFMQQGEIWLIAEAQQAETHTQIQAFKLNYAKAQILAEMLNQHGNVLSDIGQASFDERTNTLVVKDRPQVLTALSELIEKLDIQLRQVQIEARILNASESFSKDLGLSFAAGNDNANLSVNQQSSIMAFGDIHLGLMKLPKDIHLDMFISAAEKDNRTQVLATPKLLTANQQEAVIKQGKEIAFEETSASGATSIRFKEAVLELRVTPHITPNNEVILNLHVKHDMIGKLADNGQPTIDTKSITTQVQVQDGETVVLGGIYSKTDIKQKNKIPLLGDIPGFGRLFQGSNKIDDKDELLIFVTPRILA